MEFLELVKLRESVRGYIDKKVEEEKILKCIEAARLAPSACNSQPWKFVVVNDKEILSEIKNKIYDSVIGINKFVLTAPVIIAVVGEKRNLTSAIGSSIKKKDYTSMDVGIAVEHLCLQATELGLGTCIIGWFKNEEIKKALGIPKNRDIELIVSLGYNNNENPREKKRKNIEDIVAFNKY
ncbi:Nitroreductase [Clostridium collagenovorans DSM 3089]|uniref:Nitroreductase n=1 Tax=Clostridium collagenovorans DSM 3089 TaxID=1121306 RepID=A0A1M5U8D9_9CLOT|nr:nitroreductase family protein [Clostridium collagenovorans]SHH59325.1 Nitroreductase [Clostridium collagenovorans DSM 3089]